METVGTIILGILIIYLIIWGIVKVNSIDSSLKMVAKTLEVLTQNQKLYFQNRIKDEQFKEPPKFEYPESSKNHTTKIQ